MKQHVVPLRQTLLAANMLLHQRIGSANASPFLGHLVLDPDRQLRAIEAVRSFVGGDPRHFLDLFSTYRLLFAWTIARAVAERYADDGSSNVYRPIAVEIGCDGIPTGMVQEFSRKFRSVCSRHGLALAPSLSRWNDYVGDYVAQAGVAHSQLFELACAFRKQSDIFGPPPVEDTDQLYRWSCEAADRAHPGLTRLRRVIVSDTSGFHATTFRRLLEGLEPATLFERRFAEAMGRAGAKESGTGSQPVIQPPALIFRDGELAVQTSVRGRGVMMRLSGRDRFVSAGLSLGLPLPPPSAVSWWPVAADEGGAAPRSLTVVEPDTFLVFDAHTGALLSRVQVDCKSQAIESPEVFVVALRPIEIDGEEATDLGGLFARFASLEKGSSVRCGSRTIRLTLVTRPRLIVQGKTEASHAGVPFVVQPTKVRVLADPNTLGARLAVRIEHPALPKAFFADVEVDESGGHIARLDGLPAAGLFGALRLSLELNERPLARTRIWFWPGLAAVEEGMVFDGPIPVNFEPTLSRNVIASTSGRLELAGGEDYLTALAVFRCAGGEPVHLSFPRRGVLVSVVSASLAERAIKIGSRIVPSDAFDATLVVRAPSRSAGLDICGRREPEAFARTGVRRISLASLAVTDGHDDVVYWPAGDEALAFTLVRVVPTTAPKSFTLSERAERIEIKCSFECPVDAARLDLVHAVDGGPLVIEAAVGRRPVEEVDGNAFGADQESAGRNDLALKIDRRRFPTGVWLAELSVRREGEERWRPVVNDRLDSHAFAFRGNDTDHFRLESGSDEFLRLTRSLMTCYAIECWTSVERSALVRWRELGRALARLPNSRRILLEAAGESPPVSSSSTWIPILHPLELSPDLFEAPLDDFVAFSEKPAEGCEHLARLSRLGPLVGIARAADAAAVLDEFGVAPLIYPAFANFARARLDPSLRLGRFDVALYLHNLVRMGEDHADGTFWAPDRPWLTASHHAWCCEAAAARLRRLAPPGSVTNQERLPGAVALARQIGGRIRAAALAAPTALCEEWDILSDVPAALSTFSRACRQGTASDLLASVHAKPNVASRRMALILRIAPELFAYYTALWHLAGIDEAQ